MLADDNGDLVTLILLLAGWNLRLMFVLVTVVLSEVPDSFLVLSSIFGFGIENWLYEACYLSVRS